MEFKEIIDKSTVVRKKYAIFEKKMYGKEWTNLNITQGFVGDVGDLMKIIMAKENIRKMDNVDEKLAHELSDCLWSILVLADKYNIDLEKDFGKTMAELENKIDSKLGK